MLKNDRISSLSQRAIQARARQSRFTYVDMPKVPVPPVRGISKAERDEAYQVLSEALYATNGLRVRRHPQRDHLIDSLLLGFEGGIDDVYLLAANLQSSDFLRGKRWLNANRLLTDVTLQCAILEGQYAPSDEDDHDN